MVAIWRVMIVGALSLVVASTATAQQRGSISGRVLDAGGLVLPGATITITEQNTGFTRTVVTAEEAVVELRGRYDDSERLSRELSSAIAGTYRRVRIDLDGAEFLGDEAAAVLRRAMSAARAAGVELRVVAERAGTRRWLARWGLEETSGGAT